MSKELVVKDGTVFSVTDNSTIDNFVMVFQTVSEMSVAYGKLTEDNLSEVTFGGKTYARVSNGTQIYGISPVEVHVSTIRKPSAIEIQLEETIAELNEQKANLERNISPRLGTAETEITDAQVALAEIYEQILGGTV